MASMYLAAFHPCLQQGTQSRKPKVILKNQFHRVPTIRTMPLLMPEQAHRTVFYCIGCKLDSPPSARMACVFDCTRQEAVSDQDVAVNPRSTTWPLPGKLLVGERIFFSCILGWLSTLRPVIQFLPDFSVPPTVLLTPVVRHATCTDTKHPGGFNRVRHFSSRSAFWCWRKLSRRITNPIKEYSNHPHENEYSRILFSASIEKNRAFPLDKHSRLLIASNNQVTTRQRSPSCLQQSRHGKPLTEPATGSSTRQRLSL